jgi:hypothetical protein
MTRQSLSLVPGCHSHSEDNISTHPNLSPLSLGDIIFIGLALIWSLIFSCSIDSVDIFGNMAVISMNFFPGLVFQLLEFFRGPVRLWHNVNRW